MAEKAVINVFTVETSISINILSAPILPRQKYKSQGGFHMPREKPLYHDTLSSVRARATELFPGELLFGPTKVAKILGRSRAWVWRHYGSFNSMTVEQIASLIC